MASKELVLRNKIGTSQEMYDDGYICSWLTVDMVTIIHVTIFLPARM